jgi:hypothetical protein
LLLALGKALAVIARVQLAKVVEKLALVKLQPVDVPDAKLTKNSWT